MKRTRRSVRADLSFDNSRTTDAQAIAEIDRCYVLPGQALAYRVGELKIKALHARAQTALGERFDIRRFHNALIDDGPLRCRCWSSASTSGSRAIRN